MGKFSASKETVSRIIVIVAAAAFWAWVNLFHDVGASYYHLLADAHVGGRPFGVYLSCIASPLGFAFGSLAAFASRRRKPANPKTAARTGVIACAALSLLFYAVVALTNSYVPSSIVSFCVTATGTLVFFRSLLALLPFAKQDIVPLVLACLVVHKFSTPLVVGVLSYEPIAYMAAFHMAFLALFGACLALVAGQGERSGLTTGKHPQAQRQSHRPPWPLCAHLVCYGLGFGIVHGMLGFGEYVALLYTALGLLDLPLLVVLVVLCVRRVTKTEALWQRVRGVVYPITVLGYSLVTVTLSPSIPSVIVESASGLYDALFVLGCFIMARETAIPFAAIASLGCFFKSAGFSLGVLFGYFLGGSGIFASQTTSSIMFIAVFVAFSAGTFWIGSEQSMRKWWGLRREKTPEHQHVHVLQEKCAMLAQRYKLSYREKEVLVLLAEGKRAAQIKDEYSLSISTVRGHIQNVYNKLDVHSAQELENLIESVQVIAL